MTSWLDVLARVETEKVGQVATQTAGAWQCDSRAGAGQARHSNAPTGS